MELQTALVKSGRSAGVQRQSGSKLRQSAWRLHKDFAEMLLQLLLKVP